MASYENFARVYDLFMSDTPYDEWCAYLHGLLVKYGVTDGLVLDLGCGTGAMTERLSRLGYDMIGVDNSVDMLEIARENHEEHKFPGSWNEMRGNSERSSSTKVVESFTELEEDDDLPGALERSGQEPDVLYLLQDMRAFELYGTVRAVVSICDSMNYITEEEDLLQVFRLVNNYLDPGGVFIFDLNTEYKYRELLADHVFAENRDEGSFIWENWFDAETQINEYDLTLYIRRETPCKANPMECLEPDACLTAGTEETLKPDECLAAGSEETSALNADVHGEENRNQNADICEEEVYERYEETHLQRAWSMDRVRALLEEAGMRFEAVYDAFTEKEPHQKSERVYFIARENGK